jgi:hypothetical protein
MALQLACNGRADADVWFAGAWAIEQHKLIQVCENSTSLSCINSVTSQLGLVMAAAAAVALQRLDSAACLM